MSPSLIRCSVAQYTGLRLAIGKHSSGKMALMGAWFEWASLGIGAGGLIASIAGLIFAFLARRAAKSAAAAATEARNSVSQTLCLVSAQRALSIIARLRTLHRDQSWTAALELYRELRTLLNDIVSTIPRGFDQTRADIEQGIGRLSLIQSLIQESIAGSGNLNNPQPLSESLNSIEATLEALVSSMMPASGEES